MAFLLVLLLLVLIFGVWGLVKAAIWAFIIAAVFLVALAIMGGRALTR
jgi:hypothetical protein